MYINTFRYTPKHVDCRYCTEFVEFIGCTSPHCPWLAERMEAGVVGYGEAVVETMLDFTILRRRLCTLIRQFPGTLWLDEGHKWRMAALRAYAGYNRRRDTPEFFAAMYLISSHEELFSCAGRCFVRRGIDFSKTILRDMSPLTYTLLAAAKDIYTGSNGLTVEDIADREIVDTEAFRLIVNAILIARYGLDALHISKRNGDRYGLGF